MELRKENKMGTAPILKLLISMSVPMMLSMLVLALYNIVDSVFVAKISDNALTGLSLSFPFQMLINAVGVGTAVGTNSLISRKLGERQNDYANKAAATGLALSVISGIVLSVLFFFLSKPLMKLFSDDADILLQATTYLKICGSLCTFLCICTMCEKILQATGNMIHPMLIQLFGAIVNIILDPILIFGLLGFPKMGVAGAAYATVIGQLASAVLGAYYLFFHKKNDILHISFKGLKLKKEMLGKIYEVGIASILMQSIASFTTLILNGILIEFTAIAVNVLGVYFKIQSFIFMPVFGLSSGALPIMGYNYGAKNKERYMKTLKYAMLISVGIMLIGLALFQFIPKQLLGMFNDNEEMLNIGVFAFRIISISFPFAGVAIILITAFNSIGRGINSLIVSVIRQFVIIIPAAYVLSKLFGLNAVWFAYPIAEVIGMTLALILMSGVYKNKLVTLDTNPV